MPLLDRILGWSPPDNEDFLDVPLDPTPLLPLQNPTFHISEPVAPRRPRRTVSGLFHTASPASSSDGHDSDDAQHDKRVEHPTGKHADPAWVARPRNEFILFRCDYVRKHSREGKRVRRAPGAEAEKTLSKQAAEAWHHLPPEERLYWKERANGERNEHARRYPDYRYRPKKSATGRRRQTRCSPVKPVAPVDRPSVTAAPESAQHPETAPPMSLQSSTAMSSKSTPRRHASVPDLNITERMHRRLRSTASQGWISASTAASDRIDFSHTQREYTPMPTLDSTPSFEPSDYISPDYASTPPTTLHSHSLSLASTSSSSSGLQMQSTTSSLLNWNGARMVAAAPQPTQYLSSTSVSLSSLAGMDHNLHSTSSHLLSEYTTGGNPEPLGASVPVPASAQQQQQPFNALGMHYHTQGDIWMAQLHPGDGAPQMEMEMGLHAHLQIDPGMVHGGMGVKEEGHELHEHAHAHEHGHRHELEHDVHAALNHPHGAVYDAAGRTLHLADYASGGGVDHGSPSALFAMDTDEFFNPNY